MRVCAPKALLFATINAFCVTQLELRVKTVNRWTDFCYACARVGSLQEFRQFSNPLFSSAKMAREGFASDSVIRHSVLDVGYSLRSLLEIRAYRPNLHLLRHQTGELEPLREGQELENEMKRIRLGNLPAQSSG